MLNLTRTLARQLGQYGIRVNSITPNRIGSPVGMGRSLHAGQVCVADGTDLAAAKIERVLTNDPAMGVIRHVDAGYDRAAEVAAERGVRIPMAE